MINGRPFYLSSGNSTFAMWFESGADPDWVIGRISAADAGIYGLGYLFSEADTVCPDFNTTDVKELTESGDPKWIIHPNATLVCKGKFCNITRLL